MKKILLICFILIVFCLQTYILKAEEKYSVKDLILQANIYESTGNFEKAREIYNSILTKTHDLKEDEFRKKLESLNIKIFFSGFPKSDFLTYEIKSGDNLNAISNKYNVPVELIMEINKIISIRSLKIGQKMLIPAFTKQLKISVDTRKNILILYKEKEIIKHYSVATGKNETPSPIGIFTISSRIENPTWTLNGINIPGGDPKNALGPRWMGFEEQKQYGIHGTIEPESIGKNVSQGCIRMNNNDVIELFKIIPLGTKVEIF
ncbi:MAG: L,D-transpeptidase family protein [Candidatus Firestonebacteria bacterium]|nr:L,D-transpeptidase family protein [Candidatus Firestonebacteria bacterium]